MVAMTSSASAMSKRASRFIKLEFRKLKFRVINFTCKKRLAMIHRALAFGDKNVIRSESRMRSVWRATGIQDCLSSARAEGIDAHVWVTSRILQAVLRQ